MEQGDSRNALNNNDVETNQSLLQEAADTQRRTREALARIQRQAAETEAVGHATLAELEEQDRRIDQISQGTGRLHEKLDKSKRLQDRFAAWGLQVGTGRTATKLARKERKDEKKLRLLNENESKKAAVNQDWFQGDNPSRSSANEINRADLFGADCNRRKKGRGGREDDKGKTDIPPLSDEDRLFLNQIEAEDQALESELDGLGKQVNNLLSIVKSMGEEAGKQNRKLDKGTDDIEKANHKQTIVNHRARLFTMTRRQKRNERTIEKKAYDMASSVAHAVVRS
jgi:hypothetical protein